MANKTRTYLSTDWQVWTQINPTGSFVLDFSVLDGTDVLASTGGTMTVSTDKITNITISEGQPTYQGIFNDLVPRTLTLSLLIKDFTPSVANKYLVNTPIWVTLKNEQTLSDSRFGKTSPQFIGTISSFVAEPATDSQFTSVTVTAISQTTTDLNQLVTIQQSSSTEMGAAIYYGALNSGITIGITKNLLAPGTYQFPTIATPQTRNLGTWLDNFRVAYDHQLYEAFALTSVNGSGEITVDQQIRNEPSIFTTQATFTDSNILDMQFDWVGSGSPTGVNLTLYSDSTVSYQYGNTGSQIGANVYNYDLDVANLSQLASSGQNKLFHTSKYLPITVRTKTAQPFQPITFQEGINAFGSYWVNVANMGVMADNIAINSTKFGINETMRVVGKTQEINPDGWFTTYNLWKAL